jgi:DNA-binding transcriptional ArsR family regulator
MDIAMPAPQPLQLDNVFAALADPTRRAIIDRLLARGELSVGEVAAPFDISTPAITRHLQVLERAGLIERRVERQWRFVRVRANALAPVESWLSRHQQHWSAALDRMEALAAAQTPRRKKS